MKDTFAAWDEKNSDPVEERTSLTKQLYPEHFKEEGAVSGRLKESPVRRGLDAMTGETTDPHIFDTRPMSRADFDELCEKKYQTLLGTVRSIPGMRKVDAEDILHDVLIRLCETPEKLDASKNPVSWIRQAIKWQALDFKRNMQKRYEVEGLSLDKMQEDEYNVLAAEEDALEFKDTFLPKVGRPSTLLPTAEMHTLTGEIGQATDRLPAKVRIVYQLAVKGYTQKEIAKMIGVTRKTVQLRWEVVQARLKARFGEHTPLLGSVGKMRSSTDQGASSQ